MKGSSRETFGSHFAVIMAMAGSAIGFGNIWRFPTLVGQYGGAAFVLLYLLFSFLLALPIFYCESIIGRRSRANAFGAFRKLDPKGHWHWLGMITVIAPLLILSYYNVVGGWSAQYLFKSLAGDFVGRNEAAVTGYFGQFISSAWAPLLAHGLFAGAVAVIVVSGVKSGIERFTKWTMPMLFLLIIAIVVYSVNLPGARAGVEYLVRPDLSKLSGSAVASAMGQAFFSLSLGMGTILTYSSYMSKKANIAGTGFSTALADMFFALLAAFAVMPAVFAGGLEPGSGPGLIFESLPLIFNRMGAGLPLVSTVVAVLFFFSVLMAALTSAISLLEVGVAYLSEETRLSRKQATWLLSGVVWLVGIVWSLSFGPLSDVTVFGKSLFDAVDTLCSNILMPIGGLVFVLFVSWKMPSADVYDEYTNGGTLRFNHRIYPAFRFLVRFVAPVGIALVALTPYLF